MSIAFHSLADHELLANAAAWPEMATLRQINAANLRSLTAEHGIDFATALLYDRISKVTSAEGRISLFADQPSGLFEDRPAAKRPLIVIVPGAFHRETDKFDASGRAIIQSARSLSLETASIPLRSFGTLAENAEIILNWLAEQTRRPMILVSQSKGGADLKHALSLSHDDAVWENVEAWIDLSGICEGTPLADWLVERWYRSVLVRAFFAWHNYDFDVVHELRSGPGRSLSRPLILPPHTRALHVLGFPRGRHLSGNLARRGHRRLAQHGPNDGSGIVLLDAAQRSGIILPVWGVDHFLRNDRVNPASIFKASLAFLKRTSVSEEAQYREAAR